MQAFPRAALRLAHLAARPTPRFAVVPVRLASTTALRAAAGAHRDIVAEAARANTNRPDFLLKTKHASQVRELHHYTQYVLLAGIPAGLALGQPLSTLFDIAAVVALPLHFHIGMRSIIIDYVEDVPSQQVALAILAGLTVLTAAGIVKLSLTDVGLTQTIRELWVHQE